MTVEEVQKEFPAWHVWPAANGLLHARRLSSSPVWLVYDPTPDGLAARMKEFERVWKLTGRFTPARDAAQGLRT